MVAQDLSRRELDSLYNKFIRQNDPEISNSFRQNQSYNPEDMKCGFGIANQIKINIDNFTTEQQYELKKLLQRPDKQTSIISPSGIFRIHYDSTGSEVPKYDITLSTDENVMQVALALDSAYNFEVGYLEYPAPPADNGAGGDDLYDIYITNAGGDYGVTKSELNLGGEKYTSFIEIHYSLDGFYTEGLAAMRVTVAHELHHAIQMGNYILRFDDRFFHELTSTAMEEFVFDDVNDYYGYMGSYFNTPETPLPQTSGYNVALWAIYLRDNFDYDIIKSQWELMPTTRAMFAINNSLFEYGSSFTREFNKFAIWLYYTKHRAVPGAYFEEAVNYPLLQFTNSIDFYAGIPPTEGFPKAASHNFLQYKISVEGEIRTDTLISIISNGDVQSAVNSSGSTFPFEYQLFNNSTSGGRYLSEDYSSSFNVQNPQFWSVSEILNNIVVRSDTIINPITNISESFVFPNPYSYSTGSNINFSINALNGEIVDLNIYTSGMELVFSSQFLVQGIPINNSFGIKWNPRDNFGEKLASGVYIYVIQNGEEITKGKIVIFN